MKVKRWIRSGELDPAMTTQEEIIEACGNILDHNCAYDLLGDVLIEGDDGKFYVVTVEAVISEANAEYVKDVLKEEEE